VCPKRGTLACQFVGGFDQEHCLVIDQAQPGGFAEGKAVRRLIRWLVLERRAMLEKVYAFTGVYYTYATQDNTR